MKFRSPGEKREAGQFPCVQSRRDRHIQMYWKIQHTPLTSHSSIFSEDIGDAEKRNPVNKGKDIYFGAVRTYLRTKRHRLVSDSGGAISESPSTLFIQSQRSRNRDIHFLFDMSPVSTKPLVATRRMDLPLVYPHFPCFRNIRFNPRGQTWPVQKLSPNSQSPSGA